MRAVALLSLLGLVGGCAKSATQLVVVVDSDLRVPAELAGLEVAVTSEAGPLGRQSFTLASVPVSFGVAPGDEAPLTITVAAIGPPPSSAGEPLFTRVVRTRAIAGKTLRLPIFLAASCRTDDCSAATDVDPATLEAIEPGRELENFPRPDAGVEDGGPPDAAAPEAGPVDADVDAGGGPDAEPGEAGPDALVDAGVELDAGAVVDATSLDATSLDATSPDGAPIDAGDAGSGPIACSRNSECPPDHRCLDIKPEGSRVCPTNATCACYRTCDALSAQPQPCAADEACFWWRRGAGPDSACVRRTEGGVQGDACAATFDTFGTRLGDDCDPYSNTYCIYPTPSDPFGSCARRCDVSRPDDLCAGLGTYACSDAYDPIGLCLNPPPSATDIGKLCDEAADCSTACSRLAGYCTASCALDLDVCAAGTNCIRLPNPESWTCLKGCPNGDSDCAADYYCESFGGSPSCIPKCTMPNHFCPTGRLNCDQATGRCIP